MSDDKKYLFYLNTSEGFPIRHFFICCNILKENIKMILTPKNIKFNFKDNEGVSTHYITWYGDKFDTYYYNARDKNKNLLESYEIGFKIEQMVSSCKRFTKNDGVLIYQLEDSHTIALNPIKSNNKNSNNFFTSFVPSIAKEETDEIKEIKYEERFNFKMNIKDFCDICAHTIAKKCGSLKVIVYENGGIFIGYGLNEDIAVQSTIGIIGNNIYENQESDKEYEDNDKPKILISNSDVITEVVIPIVIIKAMSKFSSFTSKNSMIYFTGERGKPLKILTKIGDFGEYVILIS